MTGWVAIDFETANALRGSPCSVGLVRVKEGQIVEEWSSFIKPPDGHDHFDAFNVRIHGITANHVRDAPGWPETLERIVQFAGDAPFVAHNAAFGIGVLVGACEASGLSVPDLRFACTHVVVTTSRSSTPKSSTNSLRWLRADPLQAQGPALCAPLRCVPPPRYPSAPAGGGVPFHFDPIR